MSFKIKELDQFQIDCNNKRCNRNTMYNDKTCKTDYKQKACYKKFLIKVEKDNFKFLSKKSDYQEIDIDTEYEEFKKLVWIRDTGEYNGISNRNDWQNYCIFWNAVLTLEEKKYVLTNFKEQLFLNRNLDVVHIESQARRPDLKLDKDNVIIGGRYFHSLLDNYQDIVTQKPMSTEQREQWLDRLKHYIKEIKEYE